MDTITHALMGAQAALAIPAAGVPGRRLGTRERLLLGAAAGAFPDMDFLGFLIHPLRFLAQWHQGPTHSLLLLPAWGALLACLFCLATRRRQAWREALAVSCLGVASHIALDLITVYGTRIFYPGSERRFSLGTTFLVDPLLSGIVVSGLGLALCLAPQRRARAALAGMALLCAYVGVQGVLRQRALELGNESLHAAGIRAQGVDALPQPFSPFNWKLIARTDTDYHVAHVNLAGHPAWVPPWQVLGRPARHGQGLCAARGHGLDTAAAANRGAGRTGAGMAALGAAGLCRLQAVRGLSGPVRHDGDAGCTIAAAGRRGSLRLVHRPAL